jgi:hypothetical protein
MYDKETIFKSALRQLQAMALHWNEEGRKRWEGAVANWKTNAEWARANDKPQPDKPPGPPALMTVTVPEGSIEQSQIVMGLSDKPVSNLPCELDPAVVADKTPGVVAVGWDYGTVFAATGDTTPDGAVIQHTRANGTVVTLRHVWKKKGETGALFGDINMYEVVTR